MNVESYDTVKVMLGLNKDLPYTPDWSAAPDFLALIAEHCLQNSPDTILECSSGITTLVLARCCQINNLGHVFSLENGEQYVSKTRQQLDEFGLSQYATVIHAPLIKQSVNKELFDWYSLVDLTRDRFKMLVIDGPPGFIQQYSRLPALPLLHDRLSDEYVIFLDDAAREDEKVIVERWQRQFPQLMHHYIETERGCSVLRINKSS